jgi:hypothetical protein
MQAALLLSDSALVVQGTTKKQLIADAVSKIREIPNYLFLPTRRLAVDNIEIIKEPKSGVFHIKISSKGNEIFVINTNENQESIRSINV